MTRREFAELMLAALVARTPRALGVRHDLGIIGSIETSTWARTYLSPPTLETMQKWHAGIPCRMRSREWVEEHYPRRP